MRADLEFKTIPAMVQASAERFGDKTAVVDGEVRLTFRDVADDMFRVAKALIANGVEPGDRVPVWAPNSAAWIPAALGVLACGAWLVPMNTRFKGHEAAFVLNKTGARNMFCTEGFLGIDYLSMVRAVDPALPALNNAVVIANPGAYGGESWTRFLASGAGVSDTEVQARIDAISPDSVADVMFTSGTTGEPKGVMLRHGTTLRCYEMYIEHFGLHEDARYLIGLPFFHCFGYKAGWMASLMSGAVAIPLAVFDPLDVMATIEREKVTHLPGSPTMFWAILDHPERHRFDLSSLRSTIVSAATIPAELIYRIRDELHVAHNICGYGLTENHTIVSVVRPDDSPEIVATTIGKLLPGITAKVVDDQGVEVPMGQPGELLLGGFAHMSGYYDEPAATAAVLADGWLHTGDIVTIDEHDYLRFVDRKKDMIIVGGFNVAPAEVEKGLAAFDKIGQVAVVGAPDHHFGEVVVAFVLPKPDEPVTPEEVIAFARERMANYKVPKRVIIVDDLPLNATGKVLKGELRKRLG